MLPEAVLARVAALLRVQRLSMPRRRRAPAVEPRSLQQPVRGAGPGQSRFNHQAGCGMVGACCHTIAGWCGFLATRLA